MSSISPDIIASITALDWLSYAVQCALGDFFVAIILLFFVFFLTISIFGWGLAKLWNRRWSVFSSLSSLVINGGLALCVAFFCLILHGLSGNNFGASSDSNSIMNRLSRLEKAIATDDSEADSVGLSISNRLSGKSEKGGHTDWDEDPILDSSTRDFIADFCKDKVKMPTQEAIAFMLPPLCKCYRQAYSICGMCAGFSLFALLLSVSSMSYSAIRVDKPSIH